MMIDSSTGIPLTPSYHGVRCAGNGLHPGLECCCDECDYYLECFPDWQEILADEKLPLVFLSQGGYNRERIVTGGHIMAVKIEKDTIIGDVLDIAPQAAPLFFAIGMHCLGCPSSRGETVEEACMVHGIECEPFLAQLNHFLEAYEADQANHAN